MCEDGSNEHFIIILETVKFDWTLPLLKAMKGQTMSIFTLLCSSLCYQSWGLLLLSQSVACLISYTSVTRCQVDGIFLGGCVVLYRRSL